MEVVPRTPRRGRRSGNHHPCIPLVYPSYDAPSRSAKEALERIHCGKRYSRLLKD
jgi:hypothetical protein